MRNTHVLPGHVEVSVLERCPSYGMSVLRGLTVCESIKNLHSLAKVIKGGIFTIFTKIVWLIWTKISEIILFKAKH